MTTFGVDFWRSHFLALPCEDCHRAITQPTKLPYPSPPDTRTCPQAAGAELEAKDGCGRTALFAAAHQGHVAAGEALFATGMIDANKEKNRNGESPVHVSAFAGQADFVSLLVARGFHINARDRKGRVALHCAAANGHADVVAVLIGEWMYFCFDCCFGCCCLFIAVVMACSKLWQSRFTHPRRARRLYSL